MSLGFTQEDLDELPVGGIFIDWDGDRERNHKNLYFFVKVTEDGRIRGLWLSDYKKYNGISLGHYDYDDYDAFSSCIAERLESVNTYGEYNDILVELLDTLDLPHDFLGLNRIEKRVLRIKMV